MNIIVARWGLIGMVGIDQEGVGSANLVGLDRESSAGCSILGPKCASSLQGFPSMDR